MRLAKASPEDAAVLRALKQFAEHMDEAVYENDFLTTTECGELLRSYGRLRVRMAERVVARLKRQKTSLELTSRVPRG
jgi:hypothetical protein